MGMNTYAATTARLDKFKGKIFRNALPRECLAKAGRQIEMPKNNSKTYVGRRYLHWGSTSTDRNTMNRFFQDGNGADRATAIANQHLTQEGVTGTPDSIVPVDTTVVIAQFDCLFGWTDVVQDTHEDDIKAEAVSQVATRVTFVNEMIIYGALKACTNAYYGGTGTTVGTVNGKLTLGLIRKIVMNLQANHAESVTTMLKASAYYGTDAVEEGYLVYCHTDLAPDIRDLPGFEPTVKYASGTPMPREIGKCEMFRFILSPDLPSIQNGGAAIGATNLYTTSGTSLDVYPIIVVGKDAWSQLALRGKSALDVTYFDAGEKTKTDPHGQRGSAGTIWWKAVLIENNGWMAVANVGRKNLPE